MMRTTLSTWLNAHQRNARLLALTLALLFGAACSELYRLVREGDYQDQLTNQTQREAASIVSHTLRGKPMGAVALEGQVDPAIRSMARSATAADPARLAETLEVLARAIDGDGAFVVNGDGIITASWDIKGRSRNGNNVKHRPYYQMAMEGMEITYAAVGGSTNERALYLAAPVFNEPGQSGAVIGAIVGRISVRDIDRLMSDWPGIALLLSPQGLVFASNRADWLFHFTAPKDDEQLKAMASLKQFGKSVEEGRRPPLLPFRIDSPKVQVDGKRYAVEAASVALNDPNGDWSVVLLGDLATVTPIWHRLMIGSTLSGALLALLLVAQRALTEGLARRAAVAEIERAAVQLQRSSEIKLQRSELVAALQQAGTPQDLADVFFQRLARLMPLHQGTLYRLDADHSLKLAGSYGTTDAPPLIIVGMGIAGQCAQQRRILSFATPPEGFWRIRTGLGEAQPRSLLVLPVIRNETLLGIIELASLNPDLSSDRALIDELLPALAMNLDILLAAQRTELALSEARAHIRQP